MPLDPSIIGSTKIPDIAQDLAQVAYIKNMNQEAKMRNLQMQQQALALRQRMIGIGAVNAGYGVAPTQASIATGPSQLTNQVTAQMPQSTVAPTHWSQQPPSATSPKNFVGPMRPQPIVNQAQEQQSLSQQQPTGFNAQRYLNYYAQNAPGLMPQAIQELNQIKTAQNAQIGFGLQQIARSQNPDEAYAQVKNGLIQNGIIGPNDWPSQYQGHDWINSQYAAQGPANEKTLAQMGYYKKYGAQKDEQMVNSANEHITNDKQMIRYQTALQHVQNMNSLLDAIKNGDLTATSQLLGDLNNEYTSVLTGTNSPPLGKQERAEYNTYKQELANIAQKITANPQSINSPQIFNQLSGQVAKLKGDYQGFMKERINELRPNYGDNKIAQNAFDSAAQQFSNQYGFSTSAQNSPNWNGNVPWFKQKPGSGRPTSDGAAPSMRQAYTPPKMGTTVVHGGITYVATPAGWAPQPQVQAANGK